MEQGLQKRLSSAIISNHNAGTGTPLMQSSNAREKRPSYRKRSDKKNPSTYILKLDKIVEKARDTVNYKPLIISVLKSLTYNY